MTEKKISQIGATISGRDYLRKLAGKSSESGAKVDKESLQSSLFTEMKEAYRTLFIYGLLKGERLQTDKTFTTIYAQLSMLSTPYDFSALLKSFGQKEDLDDIGKSINEYTNWAIEEMRKAYPKGNMTIEDFKNLMDD